MPFTLAGPRGPLPRPAARAAAIAAALGAAQVTVLAQPAPAETAIVVTGTRTAMRVDQALADITVLERAQIERATAHTLPELLAQQPGVQFWSNGGLGRVASVSMRGLESRHTLLLVDGVRHGSATLGTPVWENIALRDIERIEIVRGPLSALYGSDAVGGVVQVFTRQGAPGLRGQGEATAGSSAYRQLAAGVRWGAGALDAAVNVQALRSGGISATNLREPFGSFNPDRDGFDQDSASARLAVNLAGGWRLQAQALHAKGLVQFDDGPGADARAALLSQVASLQASGPVLGPWRSSLRLARSVDEFDLLATASIYNDLGVTGTVLRQFTWENTVATPAGTLLLVAERVKQDVSRAGTPFAISTRTITGWALGLNGTAGGHHWQAAARRDRNSQFGSQTTGSLGYAFDLTPQWRIGASTGTSFVAPSFNQLYYPGFGNPDLQPEKGRHQEVHLRWSAGAHQWRATWFDNHIRGYITSGPGPTNVPRTRIDGVTLAWDTRLAPWTLSASVDLLDPRNDTASSADAGKRLPRRARHTLRLAADRSLGAWTLGGTLQQVGSRFEDAGNTTEVAGYATLDLRAQWQAARDWALGLRLNNATDRRYETVLGYNQPGRGLFVILRYGAS